MAFMFTKFSTNFLFVFWPTLASVPEYPKYLGMGFKSPQNRRPPLDTFTTLCIKLFFGAMFDSIRFGAVIAILYWFFKSLISAFSLDYVFYAAVILISVLVYLIIYAGAAVVGSKAGIFPSSPEFSRRRVWSWMPTIKRSISMTTSDTHQNDAATVAEIIEEGQIFYTELRSNLRREKELAIEWEYQERLKEFYLNEKSRRVVTRISLPTEQHKSLQPKSPTKEVASQRHENVPAESPKSQSRNPDCNANLTNYVQQRNPSANTCPNSEACECERKRREGVVPLVPVKKHVNFEVYEEIEEDEEDFNKNLVQRKASQYTFPMDNDDEAEEKSQHETKEFERPEMEQPIAETSKMGNPVRNRKVLTPILKKRPNYQQQNRERKGTPTSPRTPESPPTHPKLYSSPKTNKNVRFDKQKPKRE